jgi:hypothetical protein
MKNIIFNHWIIMKMQQMVEQAEKKEKEEEGDMTK